jgi:hypothetical protein
MRSRASSFKLEYPLLSPRSSNNFLRLLLRLLVTSIRPFIFPSITSFRRQFLRKTWPIQLAHKTQITRYVFYSLTCYVYSYFAALSFAFKRCKMSFFKVTFIVYFILIFVFTIAGKYLKYHTPFLRRFFFSCKITPKYHKGRNTASIYNV